MPRREPGQRTTDAYGNIAHLLTIEAPHREICILVQCIVETTDTNDRQDEGPLSPLNYLASTNLTAPNEDLRAFAQQAVDHIADPQTRAAAPVEAVFNAVRYQPGSSDLKASAAVAFSSLLGTTTMNPTQSQCGLAAITSISTSAPGATSAATCTALRAGLLGCSAVPKNLL